MMGRRLSALALGLTVSGGALVAAEGMPSFEALDANGDGKLTKAEVKQSDAISMETYKEADFGELTENDNVTQFEYETYVNDMKDQKGDKGS